MKVLHQICEVVFKGLSPLDGEQERVLNQHNSTMQENGAFNIGSLLSYINIPASTGVRKSKCKENGKTQNKRASSFS